jgi:hypothetical protein
MKTINEMMTVVDPGGVVWILMLDEDREDREDRRLAMDCPLLAGATYRCRRENHAGILKPVFCHGRARIAAGFFGDT